MNKLRKALVIARVRLGWFIMPAEVKSLTLKPELPGEAQARKKPTQLWLNRREAMIRSGYNPRDTASP